MAVSRAIQVVSVDFPAQSVAVNTKQFCGPGLVSVGPFEGALYKLLLELADGLFQQDSALDHHPNQRFELFFHSSTLREARWRRPWRLLFQSSAWPVTR